MLNRIKIKGVASYDSSGINVNLKRINYIFGSNGTGKTTISELLRNKSDVKFSSCEMEWAQGSPDTDLYVYNRHFVEENFNLQNEIKGIFTLGKESSEIVELINEKTNEVEDYRKKIENLQKNINERKEELGKLKENFTVQSWKLKQKYDNDFKNAFTGLRNNKDRFVERCLKEAESKTGTLYTFEELTNRVESVFKGSKDKLNVINKIPYNKLLENQSIFQTKIVGKGDINLAGLINELNISDWVQQGHKHIEESDGICPFCQQILPENFKAKLDTYFDETYAKQIEELTEASGKYKTEVNQVLERYQTLLNTNNPYLNKEKVSSIILTVNSTYKENIQLLNRKMNEPSRSIELSSIMDYIKQLDSEIEKANRQILELNRVIDNLKDEEVKLIKDIWRYIVEENSSNFQNYKTNSDRLYKTLNGMKQKQEKHIRYRNTLQRQVIDQQNQLTSVAPSINEINSLLKSFGFTNFLLAEAEQGGSYRITRENGESANETLSEGEKTFITFLYFYQLINGSYEQDKVNTPRVIVIDDPISSLDNNILFIVSHLINDIKNRIRSGGSNFKQLIILTHNVYFHKEVSFNKSKKHQHLNDESFWILRKEDNISYITYYEKNPIKNSYELLWNELKENLDSISAPNIMRRILENYFRFFGNISYEEVFGSFPEAERAVCNSLLSWINDGSHHIDDDLFVDSNPEVNRNYFDIFRRIFVNSKHESHFHMMMGNFEYEKEEAGDVQEALEQAAYTKE